MIEVKANARVIVLHEKDNVATALEDLPEGEIIFIVDRNLYITLKNEIKFGHKFSLKDTPEGESIYKYGVPIGRLTNRVQIGEHVHLHNLVTLQRKGDSHERV